MSKGRARIFCSVAADLGEPSAISEAGVVVLNEPVQETSVAEEAEGREGGCS
jgi:hypothetical protein